MIEQAESRYLAIIITLSGIFVKKNLVVSRLQQGN